MDLRTLVKRYRMRKSQRTTVEALWEEIDKYVAASLSSTQSNPTEGSVASTDPEIWDFTAPDASARLSASIQQATANPAVHFAKPSWSRKELRDDYDAGVYAEKVEQIVFEELENSEFYTELEACIQEFVDHHNGFMFREPTFHPDGSFAGFEFSAVPCIEAYFDPDRKGGVKNFWRRFSWVASQIVDLCEKWDWPVPKDIQKAFEAGDDTRYEIVFAVFERPEIVRKYRREEMPATLAPDQRPYGCLYFRNDSGEQIGEEDGYFKNPVTFSKWKPKAGSIWGTGLGAQALPTAKYINGWMNMVRVSGEIALQPAWFAQHRGIRSEFDQGPNKIIYVDDPDKMKPVVSGVRFDVAIEQTRDLRSQIKELYHYDDLQLKDSPQMTAMEAQIRYELMNRILGTTFMRFQTGHLAKIFRDCVDDLERVGRLPEMPAIVKKYGGLMSLEFQGAFARSQRTDEVAAIERFTAQTAGLSQYFPEALAIINVSRLLRAVAEKLGVPKDMINSEATVKKIVAEQKAAQQAAMQADNQRKQAAAMKDAAAAQSMMQPAVGGGIAYPGTVPLTPEGTPA